MAESALQDETPPAFSCNFPLFPVAKTPEKCVVGPKDDERVTNLPSWHSSAESSSCIYSHKRKRSDAAANPSSTDSFSHAVKTFLSSGCCVIPDVLPQKFISDTLVKATNDLEFLEGELNLLREKAIQEENANLLAQVGRGDFRELVDRDGGRRDVRFQLDRYPLSARGLIYNSTVFPIVKALLGGGDICLLYAGVMWAKPNNSADEPQKWHGDGGHLFHHTHLPPHCINVFYPLVDLSKENGCTEFVPGSHQLGSFDKRRNHQFGLCCKAGGAVLFDYRLKHRGGSNVSKKPRPVLYLAYAKPFFRDAGNSRSGTSLVHSKSMHSPPWVSRILQGGAEKMGQGFENQDPEREDSSAPLSNHTATAPPAGSGERWVLFRMNVEVPNCDEAKTITVYHGDVANEVSAQFCQDNGLDESFVSVLAGAIQQQMDSTAA
jgi:ectoine hydroxylase-related dioxygenase (phytanoyl-CoA dioxygenase family)